MLGEHRTKSLLRCDLKGCLPIALDAKLKQPYGFLGGRFLLVALLFLNCPLKPSKQPLRVWIMHLIKCKQMNTASVSLFSACKHLISAL